MKKGKELQALTKFFEEEFGYNPSAEELDYFRETLVGNRIILGVHLEIIKEELIGSFLRFFKIIK
jgi:hypothetical protein